MQMDRSTKKKQTHGHREPPCGCQGVGREQLGVWGWQMQTIVHRMDRQQGPAVELRELYPISRDTP